MDSAAVGGVASRDDLVSLLTLVLVCVGGYSSCSPGLYCCHLLVVDGLTTLRIKDRTVDPPPALVPR